MIGVTPASAYCGAKLVEAVGLDPGVSGGRVPRRARPPGRHRPRGAGRASGSSSTREASIRDTKGPQDVGEFRYRKDGRPHFNGPDAVRALHEASGYRPKARLHAPASPEAYATYSAIVSGREPVTVLDLLRVREAQPDPRSTRSSPRKTCCGASWCRA